MPKYRLKKVVECLCEGSVIAIIPAGSILEVEEVKKDPASEDCMDRFTCCIHSPEDIKD